MFSRLNKISSHPSPSGVHFTLGLVSPNIENSIQQNTWKTLTTNFTLGAKEGVRVQPSNKVDVGEQRVWTSPYPPSPYLLLPVPAVSKMPFSPSFLPSSLLVPAPLLTYPPPTPTLYPPPNMYIKRGLDLGIYLKFDLVALALIQKKIP